jgi:hypothetical protein
MIGGSTMLDGRQLFLRLALAGLMTGGVAITPTGVANAAPFSIASLGTTAAPFEKAAWVPRCWWRGSPWGPQQVCRQVWMEPRYYDYDRGYGFRGDWHYRHENHEEDDD